MPFHHNTVLLYETVEALCPAPGKVMLDGTLGGGGHAGEILSRILPGGKLLGIDRDAQAIAAATAKLRAFGEAFLPIHTRYDNIIEVVRRHAPQGLDGCVLDLGISSHQVDAGERGFSYWSDAPLDMRMDREQPFSADQVVNAYTLPQLADVLFRLGEERFGNRIAAAILAQRPIKTTGQLAAIVRDAIPAAARRSGPHPARRTFQAIRMEVNDELGCLRRVLEALPQVMRPGGRVCVITFHSLEDRMVKQAFVRWQNPCTCPPQLPQCVCGKLPLGKVVFKKGVLPQAEEIQANPRARSARLRVFEMCGKQP